MTWSAFRLPDVGLNDVVDILVIAYLIYKVLIWVKETRAWSLIKGLGIIILVYIASSVFQLRTASWIIVNSLNVGLVAVLVLFQPELRKLLTEIGEGKINKFIAVSNQESDAQKNAAAAEITKAVAIMSRSRTGALIVIERETPLGEFENSGIMIDAVCSSQLLINIFEDKTPLHDGAVIIKNNRIVSACCILPLTENEIGHELGTRHRAAVGASEITDADIIVVSEETGGISIAKNGVLNKNLSEDAIKDMLFFDARPQKKMQLSLKRRS